MALTSLEWLNLSHNKIKKIQNVYYLSSLTTLYLSIPLVNHRWQLNWKNIKHFVAERTTWIGFRYAVFYKGGNMITQICNLQDLKNLEMLGLELNQIEKIENLDALENLKLLLLGGNRISEIEGVSRLLNLELLSLCKACLFREQPH